MSRQIEVWADWLKDGKPLVMGSLRSILTRGKEVFSFTYDDAWLAAIRGIAARVRLMGLTRSSQAVKLHP